MWATGIVVLYQLMTWVAVNQGIPSKLKVVKQSLKDKRLDWASNLNHFGLPFYWFGNIKEPWDQQVFTVFTSWVISFLAKEVLSIILRTWKNIIFGIQQKCVYNIDFGKIKMNYGSREIWNKCLKLIIKSFPWETGCLRSLGKKCHKLDLWKMGTRRH